MGNIFNKKKYYETCNHETSNYNKNDKKIILIYCGDVPVIISLDNIKMKT